MDETTAATAQGDLSHEEIEAFAAEWSRRLDEHVPATELMPMLAAGVKFHLLEGLQHGIDAFPDGSRRMCSSRGTESY